MTTYTDKAQCPKGHTFNITRRVASAGYVVQTRCRACDQDYKLRAGAAPAAKVALAAARRMTERDIEARLVARVRELGGEVRKVAWIGRNGAPDRLVMLPRRDYMLTLQGAGKSQQVPAFHHPTTIWVELKAPGLAARFPRNAHERAQQREHERMRRMGQRVEVVDSYERIEELLK